MNLTIARDVLLNRGFVAKNAVTLRKARIAGRLEINAAEISSLDLADASANALVDGVDQEDWQPQCRFDLDGFTYQRISREPPLDPAEGYIEEIPLSEERANLENRLIWLEMQAKFTRQPYLQLANVLKSAGDERGFRRVRMRMEERARDGHSWWKRGWGKILKWTIGYGYASQRAIYWIFGLVVLGMIVYWHGQASMIPTQKEAYIELQRVKETPAYYGHFHALAYSVDNSFPLIKLGTQEKWMPREPKVGENGESMNWAQWLNCWTASPVFLHTFRLFQIGMGWILTTLFAVGITGVIRKD